MSKPAGKILVCGEWVDDPTYAKPVMTTAIAAKIDTAKAAKRWRYDSDMECFIEIRDGMNSEAPETRSKPKGCISDIENYRAVGIQDPSGRPGEGLVITGGRRQHRDELRARGLVEVGNESNGWGDVKTSLGKMDMPSAAPMVREALAMTGYYDGARSLSDLRRQRR